MMQRREEVNKVGPFVSLVQPQNSSAPVGRVEVVE
jgi:hypothetical protein